MDDRILVFIAFALAVAPAAFAQAPPASDNESVEDLPVGTGAPGPQQSVEGPAGNTYAGALLLGTIAFVGLLGWLSFRYSHARRRP